MSEVWGGIAGRQDGGGGTSSTVHAKVNVPGLCQLLAIDALRMVPRTYQFSKSVPWAVYGVRGGVTCWEDRAGGATAPTP